MSYGLKELVDSYGMSEEEIFKQGISTGICPAICTKCGYTTDMEPDQNQGWCAICDADTVMSALVLAGII